MRTSSWKVCCGGSADGGAGLTYGFYVCALLNSGAD